MFPQMNPIPPLSNAPLATNSNIMNLMNRPNLPTSGEYRKVFVGKIPPGLSDSFILKLLEVLIKFILNIIIISNNSINNF
jgi:hypothetical protein